MPTDTISAHGGILDVSIPPRVASFGVDSVHLVAHSKGGLDSREYLANHQAAHDGEFDVLSYTSLDTPQDGTISADLLIQVEVSAYVGGRVRFSGFPTFAGVLARLLQALGGSDLGTSNLTTSFVAGFNARNLGRLPASIDYNTVAADMDLNSNGRIDRAPDEYAALRIENGKLQALDSSPSLLLRELGRRFVDIPYQILLHTRTVSVNYRRERTRTVAWVTGTPTSAAVGNDVLVTIPSARGNDSLISRTRNSATFIGAFGRNHASIADAGVATTILPWLFDVERRNGDLR